MEGEVREGSHKVGVLLGARACRCHWADRGGDRGYEGVVSSWSAVVAGRRGSSKTFGRRRSPPVAYVVRRGRRGRRVVDFEVDTPGSHKQSLHTQFTTSQQQLPLPYQFPLLLDKLPKRVLNSRNRALLILILVTQNML